MSDLHFQAAADQVYQILNLTPLTTNQIRDLLAQVADRLQASLAPHWADQLQVFDQVAFKDAQGKVRQGYVSAVTISESGPNAVQLHYTFTDTDQPDTNSDHRVEHISGDFFKI